MKAVSALSVEICDQTQVFEWSVWEEQSALGSPGGAGQDTDISVLMSTWPDCTGISFWAAVLEQL